MVFRYEQCCKREYFVGELYNHIIVSMQTTTAEQDIRLHKVKQGFLVKRSRILKDWKKRWMVLTKTHLYSFENQGVYRSPTQKIPLIEVSTIKSFYKNQYDKPHVFRIQSDDTFFYLSAVDHQDKWAWMTAVQKMTSNIYNPRPAQDSQEIIRHSLLVSNAVRQSQARLSSKLLILPQDNKVPDNLFKKLNLKLHSLTHQSKIVPTNKKFTILRMQELSQLNLFDNQKFVETTPVRLQKEQTERIVEVQKIVQRIVEKVVQVPTIVEKIVQRQKIVMVKSESNQSNGGSFAQLFTAMINSKLQDPKPFLDFISFLGLSGLQKYQSIALDFCCDGDCHRFVAELLLQVLNQQISEVRLNRYTAFIYILCEREMDYFYASDFRVLVQIIVRELQLYRSDLNQMINLQLLQALVTFHRHAIAHRRHQIRAIANEISNHGTLQNKEMAQQICMFLQ